MAKWRPVSGLKVVARTKFTHSLEKCDPIQLKHSKNGLCYLLSLVAQQIWIHLELLVLSPTQRNLDLAKSRTSGSRARSIQRSTRYGFSMNWMYHSPGLALETEHVPLQMSNMLYCNIPVFCLIDLGKLQVITCCRTWFKLRSPSVSKCHFGWWGTPQPKTLQELSKLRRYKALHHGSMVSKIRPISLTSTLSLDSTPYRAFDGVLTVLKELDQIFDKCFLWILLIFTIFLIFISALTGCYEGGRHAYILATSGQVLSVRNFAAG